MSTKLSNIRRPNGQTNRTVRMNNSSRQNRNAPLSNGDTWSGQSRPLRIRQSERIATITASASAGDFKVDSFPINPASEVTFPWLASIANLFDRYKFHELKFRYVNNVSAMTDGNVTIAVDFDALDSAPTDSVGMSQLAKFTTFSPWKSGELAVPVNRRGNQKWLYTLDSNAESGVGVDLKMYNLGNVFVSTEGLSASKVCGYLVAEYDVEFLDKNKSTLADQLDQDFVCFYETGGTTHVNESSGITIAKITGGISLGGLEADEEYLVSINLSASSGTASRVITGLTGVSGEYYETDSSSATTVRGVYKASASGATIVNSLTNNVINVTVAKITN